ncbi:MAG: aldehyde dehydrogenase family protein [Myxococcales bacterium]|nr:aldehyde dehydrogenase family protein [Myxococcales bacterium]
MHAASIIAGRERSTDERTALRSPWDHAQIAEVSLAGDDAVSDAAAIASDASRELRATPTYARREWLSKIADGLRHEREAFASTIVREAAKPLKLARAEVSRAETTFRLASEECARLGGEALALDSAEPFAGLVGAWTRTSPGALLAISPFNFPLNLVAHKLAPAFALGMPVVLKPAPQTPLTALLLARLALASGVPERMLSVVLTSNERAAKLVADPRFAAISFTGSAAVGWGIKERAPRKRVVLELGGNAACILGPDFEPDEQTLSKIDAAAFGYAGQVCIKTQRLFVPRARLERVTDALVRRARVHRVTDAADEQTIFGPLIDQRACERVRAWIDEAVARGAKVLTGGEASSNRMTAAIIADAHEGTRLVDEELFGPALTVHAYDALADALESIERGRYGLQCSLFTHDTRVIRQAYTTLTVGALVVNEASNFRVDSMPYGGTKDSGFGREGVRFAIDELAEKKLLVVR